MSNIWNRGMFLFLINKSIILFNSNQPSHRGHFTTPISQIIDLRISKWKRLDTNPANLLQIHSLSTTQTSLSVCAKRESVLEKYLKVWWWWIVMTTISQIGVSRVKYCSHTNDKWCDFTLTHFLSSYQYTIMDH